MGIERDWFKVTELTCIEVEKPGQEIESNIIDYNEEFYLQATFKGDHDEPEWYNMKVGDIWYKAMFYGKYMGPSIGPNAPPDLDLGHVEGDLKHKDDTYVVKGPKKKFAHEGLWRCGVVVTFTHGKNGPGYVGVLGFNEDCVIQISMFEEPY
jgi:hypothetical protein